MAVIASLAALASRLVFFAAGLVPLVQLLKGRKGSHGRGVASTLLALLALCLSSTLGSGDAARLPWLAALFVGMALLLLAMQRLLGKGNALAIYSAAALLLGIGTCVIFDVTGGGYAKQVVLVLGSLFVAALLAGTARRHPDLADRMLAGHPRGLFAIALVLFAVAPVLGRLTGSSAGGASNWVLGNSVQPSEAAKVIMVVALASYLAANAARLTKFSPRGIVPIFLVFVASLLMLVLANDFGCALILFAIALIMIACSTEHGTFYFVIIVVAFALFGVLAYFVSGTVRNRLALWLHPSEDLYGYGQLALGRAVIANGGILGCGLGHGLKFLQLPEASSDFVFSPLVEELGFLGGLVTLSCYAVIVVSSARIASRYQRGTFQRNLTIGLGELVGIEAIIIVGGVVGALPLTGITLPLVSQGGSSVLCTMTALGLACGYERESGQEADSPSLAAPAVFAGLNVLVLAVCLIMTAGIQTSEGIRACGTTSHQDLRASIVTSDGVTLAYDDPADDGADAEVTRRYPQGSLAAHVLSRYAGGIDAKGDDLRGHSGIRNLLALPDKGDDLTLTIDSRVQAAAEQQLAGTSGAIVCLDPSSGAVLALASAPTFDPSAPYDDSDTATASSLYLDRATSGSYEPGSTFKLVTLSAALERGVATPSTQYDAPATMDFDGVTVTNFQNEAYGTLSLTDATTYSVNTVYAQVGVQLGGDALASQAEAYGFNHDLPFDLSTTSPVFNAPTTTGELAWTADGSPIGNAGIGTNPLHMALVMGAIANGGTMVGPHLYQGEDTTQLATTVSAGTAATILDILSANPAGDNASAYHLIGKTGTDEVPGEASNAWYVGVAYNGDKSVVVTAVIEHAGTGFEAALPRAAAVADAALALP